MRDFIELFEEEKTVRLYRGDSSKIESFDTNQTSLFGLFGHGIYLTDNKRVANDYRSKGSRGDVLFNGQGFKTKEEVVNRWIERQAAKIDADGVDHSSEIAYWSSNVPYSDGGDWSVVTNPLRKEERAKRIAFAAEKWKAMSKTYEVRKKLDGTIVIQKKQLGGLAEFDVPLSVLSSCIDAEAEISRDVLDSIRGALRKSGDDATARDIDTYIQNQHWEDENVSFRDVFTNVGVESPLRGDRDVLNRLIKEFQENGYTGISYLGGITMGGGYRHRAYVLWDSATVNSYRI